MGWIKDRLTHAKDSPSNEGREAPQQELPESTLRRLRHEAEQQTSRLSRRSLDARLQALRERGEPLRMEDRKRQAALRERIKRRADAAA